MSKNKQKIDESDFEARIAEALFNAIRKYQASLKNVSIVALQ